MQIEGYFDIIQTDGYKCNRLFMPWLTELDRYAGMAEWLGCSTLDLRVEVST